MSNVSSTHAVVKHISGETKAFSGQRLARIIAKKGSDGKYQSEHLTETKSVSIPVMASESFTPEILASFMPQIMDMFMGYQDSIIAELVKDGADNIHDDQIGFPAIAKWLESNAGTARITKELLQAWFMEAYADVAAEYICGALKWDFNTLSADQEKVLEQKINLLRDMFAGFSSGKYSPDDARCMAMIKFVTFAGDGACPRLTTMGQRAKAVMEKRAEELSSNALGF